MKNLALLFAGACASVLGTLFIKPPICPLYLWTLIAIVVFLILYGSGTTSKISHSYNLWVRKGRLLLPPKIGILNDMGWDLHNQEIYASTSISPEEWKRELETQATKNEIKLKVELIESKGNFDSFIVILNPYGGVYPERNLKDSETLNKIFNYVGEKGLFVNVADIPGYYAYNQLLKRRLDATPPIWTSPIEPVRPFILTPFIEKLGLTVLNIEQSELSRWNVEFEDKFKMLTKEIDELIIHRAAIVERNVQAVMKPEKVKIQSGRVVDSTPLFLVKYGEGKFLISLVFGNHRNNAAIKETLVSIIITLIHEQIGN